MATPRKTFDQLSAAQQKRKLSWYRRNQGLGEAEVKRRYNAGTLGPQSASRGHSKTPEHGIKEARKNPKKYPEYFRKRAVPKPAAPEIPQSDVDLAYELNTWKDRAFDNIVRKLGGMYKFNLDTVEANVYGGVTAESGPVRGMDLGESKWTAKASKDELRAHASPQYKGNPWFYH